MTSTGMMDGTNLRRRRRKRPHDTSNSHRSASLFRPPSVSADAALALLDRINLTDEDVIAFLEGRSVDEPSGCISDVLEPPSEELEAYNERRNQIREWAAGIESGASEMDDEFMRLIPARRPEPRGLPLIPPPAAPRANNINPDNNQHRQLDNEEQERQWLEREEREAAEEVARAVRRYREQGVPEDEFELIRIRPREQTAANLTFRRICFAVLAVVTAFVCILLQTLPLLQSVEHRRPIFDNMLWDLLHVREFQTHALHCNGLHRQSTMAWTDRIFRRSSVMDCADGVLHVPAMHVIARMNENEEEEAWTSGGVKKALTPYTDGVDVSWFLKCHTPDSTAPVSPCFPGIRDERDTCARSCFRGIHDGLVSSKEIDDSLRLGALLIEQGGDHFDVHFNIPLLSKRIPKVLTKIRNLLREVYHMDQKELSPVAFRVSIALPMDPMAGINADNLLYRNINETKYVEWIEASARQNDRAAYSLPPPFNRQPARDTCNLMADLEADPAFAVHTSVFLSDGGGREYFGGVALYVDDHPSNSNRRRKVRRGITIDGTRGRVVVSTGGLENRRCRMPTRAGIRAVLQIWWG